MVSAFGLDLLPLPDGYTPLEAVCVVKALDEDGSVALLVRSTDSLNAWESLGMLDVAADTTRAGLTASSEDEGEEDDDG